MLKSEMTGDDWELYLMDIESGVQERLTRHPGWDGYAVWSPEGTQIVFDRENLPDSPKQPWVMNLEQRTSRPLGEFEGWVSINDWSEQHGMLAFHEIEGQRDLVLLDSAGQTTRWITKTGDASEHDAHFSPDGSRIAFASGDLEGKETTLELFDMNSGERSVLKRSVGRIYGLDWSPDGSSIAFVDAPGGEDDDADIFVYRLGDKSTRQVTDDPSWDHMPEYCGNSRTLFFTSYRSGTELMYRIDPDPQPVLFLERKE